jgi:primosomal protein N' (replication factor Y)
VLAAVPDRSQIVVATPGAEPVAEGGFAAAMLLDAWALLERPELRAEEETVRRWLNVAALVRPAMAGGELVVVADARIRAVQTLLRWAPEAMAENALHERTALRFPPAARLAELVGPPEAVRDLLDRLDLPPDAEVLGPVADHRWRPGGRDDAPPPVRALVRAPRSQALAMTRAVRAAQGERSAHKVSDHVAVRVDPVDLS